MLLAAAPQARVCCGSPAAARPAAQLRLQSARPAFRRACDKWVKSICGPTGFWTAAAHGGAGPCVRSSPALRCCSVVSQRHAVQSPVQDEHRSASPLRWGGSHPRVAPRRGGGGGGRRCAGRHGGRPLRRQQEHCAPAGSLRCAAFAPSAFLAAPGCCVGGPLRAGQACGHAVLGAALSKRANKTIPQGASGRRVCTCRGCQCKGAPSSRTVGAHGS